MVTNQFRDADSVRIYCVNAKLEKIDLGNPQQLTEYLLTMGKDFDRAKRGETIIIIDDFLDDYDYPYVALKMKQAAERGVNVEIIAGPVLQEKEYFFGGLETYFEWYKTEDGISEYEKLADSFIMVGKKDAALYALKKAYGEQSENQRLQSKIVALNENIKLQRNV